ncbi:MAG: hypothetical protein QOF30_855 [Acidimicrobiaceae bacterium]|jgi:hypothetical protein|nr:hypothetical protein [Acidimicrobiaceae bacterium]
MRRFKARDADSAVTPGWIDSLPDGGSVRIDDSVRTAAELVALAAQTQTAAA